MAGVTVLWPLMILGTASGEYHQLTEDARPFGNTGQWIVSGVLFYPGQLWDEVLAKKAKFHTFVFGIEITMLFVAWFVMTPSLPTPPNNSTEASCHTE